MKMQNSIETYRDRASDRRKKHGYKDLSGYELKRAEADDASFSGPIEQPTINGIGSENKGSKLLQKMGWTEGSGLGKTGRFTIRI